MMRAFNQLRRLVSKAPSPPRSINNSGYVLLDPGKKIEEERMPAYDRGLYYPVRLGDVYSSRYQVLSKLGYGANSTVWFCRDLRKHRYIALKIYIHDSRPNREIEVFRHLSTIKSSHPGRTRVRTMMDQFEIDGPKGRHQCIVHEALLTTLGHFQAIFDPPELNESLAKAAMIELLLALDFLHEEAQVIHTDIQAKNIIMGSNDDSIFKEWDQIEQIDPSARKVSNDEVVYRSRPFDQEGNLRRLGLPILSDFGEARIGNLHQGLIQPDLYRAPEVILGMEWTTKVDIWNVGVLLWDLFKGRLLFDARAPDGSHSYARHFAEMVAILGPPPVEFLQKSSQSLEYWDDQGKWKDLVEIPQNTLETLEEDLEGENKDLFLQFLRKMLQWDPEKRHSAGELLVDSWLHTKD